MVNEVLFKDRLAVLDGLFLCHLLKKTGHFLTGFKPDGASFLLSKVKSLKLYFERCK